MKRGLGILAVVLFCSSMTAYGTATLGDMAEGLYQPVEFLNTLVRLACYVTGVALIIGAVMQFRVHLENPKLTPLFTPIFMVFIGIALLLLPYFTTVFGNSWDPSEQDATHNEGELRPNEQPQHRRLPVPADKTRGSNDSDQSTGSGHWTDSY